MGISGMQLADHVASVKKRPDLNPQEGDTLKEKAAKVQKNAQVREFLLKQQLSKIAKQITYTKNKVPQEEADEDTVRQLMEESQRIHREIQNMHNISHGLSMGEKVLYGFLGAQLIIAASKDLTKSPYYYNMTKPIEELMAKGENIAPLEARAVAVEQMLHSIENVNRDAIKEGIISIQQPLLTEEDKTRIQHLADLWRDKSTTPEIYGAACKELGIDEKEAAKFYERERSLADKLEKGIDTPEKEFKGKTIDVTAKEVSEPAKEIIEPAKEVIETGIEL